MRDIRVVVAVLLSAYSEYDKLLDAQGPAYADFQPVQALIDELTQDHGVLYQKGNGMSGMMMNLLSGASKIDSNFVYSDWGMKQYWVLTKGEKYPIGSDLANWLIWSMGWGYERTRT